jgi:hypothetical protein
MITKAAAAAVIVLSMVNAWFEVTTIEPPTHIEDARR